MSEEMRDKAMTALGMVAVRQGWTEAADALGDYIGHLEAERDARGVYAIHAKAAWEAFYTGFVGAADKDNQHGGCWLITDADFCAIVRAMDAALAKAPQGGEPERARDSANGTTSSTCATETPATEALACKARWEAYRASQVAALGAENAVRDRSPLAIDLSRGEDWTGWACPACHACGSVPPGQPVPTVCFNCGYAKHDSLVTGRQS